MGRFWSILFLLVPILGVGVFACAMMGVDLYYFSFHKHWLPEDISTDGATIDSLFNFILILTGVIFIGTSLALFWFLWKYDATKNAEPVKFTHGSHTLEIVWSILPAVTLLFIAIYQMNAWADAKMLRPTMPDGMTPLPPLAQVTGRQFEWRIRYPGADGILYTEDDLFDVNELHVPMDEPVVLRIESEDVLHSFFLPNMRIKQDVVPGMRQHVWFQAVKDGQYDIVCAELCGWGHYKMKGRLHVETRKDFQAYIDDLTAKQNQAHFAPDEGAE